jgi:hypothetical protein
VVVAGHREEYSIDALSIRSQDDRELQAAEIHLPCPELDGEESDRHDIDGVVGLVHADAVHRCPASSLDLGLGSRWNLRSSGQPLV